VSDKIFIQYVGFEPKPMVRQYTFNVLASGESREYTLTILNEAFDTRRARFQDGPDICTLRLRRELVEGENHPVQSHFRVSESELDDYRQTHLPKSMQSLYPSRPKKTL
jgi:hypothetical protein